MCASDSGRLGPNKQDNFLGVEANPTRPAVCGGGVSDVVAVTSCLIN